MTNIKNKKLEKEINYYIDNYEVLFKSKYSLLIITLYVIHVIVCFWQPYIIITTLIGYKNKFWDKIITIILFLITFHWLFLKNECFISLIEKKIINTNYKTGSLCALHPGLEYAGKKISSLFNIYKYDTRSSLQIKIKKIVIAYIFPILCVFYLCYRNDFFGNYNLWMSLNIAHIIVMIYQFTQDKIIHNL